MLHDFSFFFCACVLQVKLPHHPNGNSIYLFIQVEKLLGVGHDDDGEGRFTGSLALHPRTLPVKRNGRIGIRMDPFSSLVDRHQQDYVQVFLYRCVTNISFKYI